MMCLIHFAEQKITTRVVSHDVAQWMVEFVAVQSRDSFGLIGGIDQDRDIRSEWVDWREYYGLNAPVKSLIKIR